ncbi:uncharacterized protein BO80DRAFT_234285 [Aspergillus ibericus CBS 121593]|uniref:Uncharacterized protein n=1 Tax=Aspergillus ibericus CBS 121593 TaxID=1448316 RepID=A0A395H8T0_9EURO|nr:hypothetical protein BO80DRAFT_234285 [Aspergillus ibericus CBS 121593]RAL04351.1 hypothetical protein BO80DRAFT_234285 [Aspergillus ibericus CBS 121593]
MMVGDRPCRARMESHFDHPDAERPGDIVSQGRQFNQRRLERLNPISLIAQEGMMNRDSGRQLPRNHTRPEKAKKGKTKRKYRTSRGDRTEKEKKVTTYQAMSKRYLGICWGGGMRSDVFVGVAQNEVCVRPGRQRNQELENRDNSGEVEKNKNSRKREEKAQRRVTELSAN